MFETDKESEAHIESVHTAHECVLCPINEMKVKSINVSLAEKNKVIEELKVKNENIVKSNVQLDKENKRINLAFKESQREKEVFRKEIAKQADALNDILKQNMTLNEEIKTKNEVIKLLKEDTEDDDDPTTNKKMKGMMISKK